ncbi:MAG: hypothetical protein M3Q58_01375 [Bacteroidota bacterium]|nr:hypothetical protein [Bacteroidota bacterium]
MYKYFLGIYKDKSQHELEKIVDTHSIQHVDAVKAAFTLLDEKFNISNREVVLAPNKYPNLYEQFIDLLIKGYKKISKSYFITFSWREITTAIALALLFMTITNIARYYGSEPWIEDYYRLIIYVNLFSLAILNHIIYKKEHRRRNFFMGRITQLYLTGILSVVFYEIHNTLSGYPTILDSELLVRAFFFPLIASFVVEIGISLIRRTLLVFKWQIW